MERGKAAMEKEVMAKEKEAAAAKAKARRDAVKVAAVFASRVFTGSAR